MDSWEPILLVIATIGSVLAAAGAWLHDRRSSASQLASVQRKLDAVMNHLGIVVSEDQEVLRHVDNGRMIEAVRAYRKLTGASLLDAKQAVDRIAASRGLPER